MLQPLAYRMRPRQLEDILGQEHLVGPGKIIHRMVQAKRLTSMILYGPPGIGKTSIASAIAGSTRYAFRTLNAATDGKKELEQVVEEAKFSGTLILLLDEIHRLNTTKQDFLLPHLESGRVILIGATTENPYIAINPAIRSRVQIFELKPLSPEQVCQGLTRALADQERGLGKYPVQVQDGILEHFAQVSGGDIRTSLNALELAVLSTQPDQDGQIIIDMAVASDCLRRRRLQHDKNGDAHYDVISALQKSIRGSDVDAALYYLAILLTAGELTVACRRLLVIAYEDIGLGHPAATQRTVAAIQAAEKLGLPEASIPLGFAVIDLALSPKSNTSYRAIKSAMAAVDQGQVAPVPDHLRDSHYQGADKLGRGLDYRYPHDYPGHIVAQEYMPKELAHHQFFQADPSGKYEEALAHYYQKVKEILKK